MTFLELGAVSDADSEGGRDEGQAASMKLNGNLVVAPEKVQNETASHDNDSSQEFADIMTV